MMTLTLGSILPAVTIEQATFVSLTLSLWLNQTPRRLLLYVQSLVLPQHIEHKLLNVIM